MKLYSGAKIHIWTVGTRTFMKIEQPAVALSQLDADELTGPPLESFTILSDTSIGMGCDLYLEVK